MKKALKVLLSAAMAFTIFSLGISQKVEAKEDKEVITVGISPDYKPYEYLTKKKKMVGFDIDMVRLFEEYLSEEEGQTVEFEFKQMDFDNIITQIQGDQVDVGISGFTYDKKRKVEWSEPYLGTAQVAVVPKGSDIASLKELKGKKLAAQTGATGEKAAKKIKKADVTGLKNVQDIMNALSANQYDAAIIDSGVAKQYAQSDEYTVLEGTLMDEKNYVIAKKGNTKMINRINTCIQKFKTSDDYKKLCDKYGLEPLSE